MDSHLIWLITIAVPVYRMKLWAVVGEHSLSAMNVQNKLLSVCVKQKY